MSKGPNFQFENPLFTRNSPMGKNISSFAPLPGNAPSTPSTSERSSNFSYNSAFSPPSQNGVNSKEKPANSWGEAARRGFGFSESANEH